jgi:uncharacterized SAM-binding protein YcdF (DUF218 family)
MDFFVLKQVVKNLVLPPAGALIVAILGLGIVHFTRLRRTGTALCALGLALLWLLATPLIADVLERGREREPALDLSAVPRADAIVILAGGVRDVAPEYGAAAPSLTTLQRLTYGARVARATGLPLLVSGTAEEASAMSDFLQHDFGVHVRWVENRARDTQQNAQMSAVILKPAGVRTILLVTSGTHMTRASAEFRLVGFTVIPAPTGMWARGEPGVRGWVPSAEALRRSESALYEDLGNLVLTLRTDAASRHGQ